jgi:hypothetical protein
MLNRLGLRKTLLAYSFVNGTVLAVAFLLLKERKPRSRLSVPPPGIHWVDSKLFRNGVFWSMTLSLAVTVL